MRITRALGGVALGFAVLAACADDSGAGAGAASAGAGGAGAGSVGGSASQGGGGSASQGGGGSASQGGGGAAQGGAAQGGAPATGGAGGASCLSFGAACSDSDTCCDYAGETGVCYAFGMGQKCTIPCPPDPADCPNNGQGCNAMSPSMCRAPN